MLLEECKKLYIEQANNLSNWKKLSKSDLCYKYLEFKDKDEKLASDYLSAIIYRFLDRGIKYYNCQSFKLLQEEDCYDVIVNSIMYVLEKKV